MCLWQDDEVICPFDPAMRNTIMERTGCRKMIRGKTGLKGYAFVMNQRLFQKELDLWIWPALEPNQLAKASRKVKGNDRAFSARVSAR